MRNNILTIMKKEFARFFGDRRMLFTTVLMPGLILYVMYSFMGTSMTSQYETDDDYVYHVSVENMPQSLAILSEMENMEFTEVEADETENLKKDIENEELELLVVFPENFDEAIASYDVTTATGAAPNIDMYYNSSSTTSGNARSIMVSVLDQVEASMTNKFDICMGDDTYDMASEEDMATMFMSMFLPMLILLFLFSGCMGIASESIAGEKERGTMATLLVTPMSRSHLAIGKLISLSAIGLLGGLSSFVGTMLSLPKMMGSAMGDVNMGTMYAVSDYALLLVVILSTTLVMVGAISLISAMAKTIKEATNTVMPLMIVIMVVALTAMMGDGAPTDFYWYLIPIYNTVQCMSGIFSLDYSMVNIVITTVVNLLCSGILVYAMAKLFNSEKIMNTQ